MGRRATNNGVDARANSIRFRFTTADGRQNELLDLPPTAANMKMARRRMLDIQAAIKVGSYRRSDWFGAGAKPEANRTFGEYADEWMETIVVAKSTRRSYRTALDATWLPAFRDRRLKAIRFSDIKRVIRERLEPETPEEGLVNGPDRRRRRDRSREGVSPKTINNHLTVLRAIYRTAVADRLIAKDENPTLEIANLKHQAKEADPFEADEKGLILGYFRDRCDERVWNYFDFAFHTGVRPSEQIALRWSDIDWRRRKAKIARARVDGATKGTKTNRERLVDLNDFAYAALVRQKAWTFLKDPDGHVFDNPKTGAPWSGVWSQSRWYWTPALRALKVRYREPYQTRHTFATLLLMGGVNATWISKQLGHANTGMLFKVYGTWIEGADRGAEAARANAVLMGHNGGPPLTDAADTSKGAANDAASP